MIIKLRTAILNALEKAFENELAVENYPGKPADYQLRHHKGAALVRYVGSQYKDSNKTDCIIQDRTPKFEVALLIRDLSDAAEVEPFVECIRKNLQGLKIAGCDAIEMMSDGFAGENNGIWQHSIVVKSKTKSMAPDGPDDRPKFKKLILKKGE